MMEIKRFAFEELWDFKEGAPPAFPADNDPIMDAVAASIIPTQSSENEMAAEEEAGISEEELKLATQKAYEDGLAAGLQQGIQQEREKANHERIATETQIKQLIAAFDHARSEHKHINHVIAQELKELILTASEHVAASALHALPLDSLERTIEQCIPLFIEEPHIIITVHPSIAERFGTALHMMVTEMGYRGEYKLQSDTSLSATDMRIAWEGGDASRDMSVVWNEVKQLIHAMPLQQHLEQPELFDVAQINEEAEHACNPENTKMDNADMPQPQEAVETTEESLSNVPVAPMMHDNEDLAANSPEEDMMRVAEEGDAMETGNADNSEEQ